MNIQNDNEYTDIDVIDKKLEFIFCVDDIKKEDLLKIKSLLVELYEAKYGEIPIITI